MRTIILAICITLLSALSATAGADTLFYPDPIVPPLSEEAVAALRAKAEQGDAAAQAKMGEYLLQPLCHGEAFDKNAPTIKEAVDFLEKSAAQGNTDAMYLLSFTSRDSRETALSWLEKAAEKGHLKAMETLGFTEELDNPLKMFKLYTRAAKKGSGKAMMGLSRLYITGNGISRDPKKAMEWLRKGAAISDNPAIHSMALGHIYLSIEASDDFGVQPSVAKAVYWYEAAAAAAVHPIVSPDLISIYKSGVDRFAPEKARAYAWVLWAEQKDFDYAKFAKQQITDLEKELTDQEKKQGTDLFNTWIAAGRPLVTAKEPQ